MATARGKSLRDRLIHLVACALTGPGLLLSAASGPAQASGVIAKVSISQQKMEVTVNGRPTFEWKVSTGAPGYRTPKGMFKPTRMHRMWHSRKYDNAPMPHSIFFHGGYAVHATDAIKRLGRPASHGCVRLHPDDASDLFHLVKAFGQDQTTIMIVD